LLPIFNTYPGLAEKIPHIPLGLFPTPVFHLKQLGNQIGTDHLYLKQDGVSGTVYGGNKVRKLEFILGDALRKKAKSVLTFGYAGSNHALATAIYAKQAGLTSVSILLKQPNAHYVRRNLLMGLAHDAEIRHYAHEPAAYLPVIFTLFKKIIQHQRFPYIIPPGGSSPLGIVGYVNAAFELKQQVEQGLIPEPDLIFVPMGTAGTAIGLVLGIKACGLKTKVLSVRVTDEKYANEGKCALLFNRTRSLISSMAPSFPDIRLDTGDMNILHNFFGKQYALFTDQGKAAVELARLTENIGIEGTYTGKTMAALIDSAQHGETRNKVVLFWNTYNAIDFSETIKNLDYRRLPRACHSYFETDVQPLDR
jgi:1-aminocyclopropane-1-carboxylate deaminase/D-cysteine desulfhydrase-like pyridoxal-dependent ACC family enzyme